MICPFLKWGIKGNWKACCCFYQCIFCWGEYFISSSFINNLESIFKESQTFRHFVFKWPVFHPIACTINIYFPWNFSILVINISINIFNDSLLSCITTWLAVISRISCYWVINGSISIYDIFNLRLIFNFYCIINISNKLNFKFLRIIRVLYKFIIFPFF